jgi:transcriptional regulator with XRE-family HTH domain
VPSFGENLKRLRKARSLKSKDLAARAKVARSVWSGWENDRRGLPETPTLLKVAKALRCSIDELLTGVDPDYDAVVGHAGKAAAVLIDTTLLAQMENPKTAQQVEEFLRLDGAIRAWLLKAPALPQPAGVSIPESTRGRDREGSTSRAGKPQHRRRRA